MACSHITGEHDFSVRQADGKYVCADCGWLEGAPEAPSTMNAEEAWGWQQGFMAAIA